jgi:hypothetical protein
MTILPEKENKWTFQKSNDRNYTLKIQKASMNFLMEKKGSGY